MKNAFVLIALFITSSAIANPLCNNRDVRSSVYSIFMKTNHTLTYAFPVIYQAVDRAMDESLARSCAANESAEQALGRAGQVCLKACDTNAYGVFDSDLLSFNRKSKEKVLFNECARTCISAKEMLGYYVSGHLNR